MRKIVKILCPFISASMLISNTVSFAAGYYNAAAEVNQIRYFIDHGLYLEAVRDCGNTIAWHNLSPDDISLINSLKTQAQNAYTNYINGSVSYYNAAAEVNQIRSFINGGLYLEAIRECDNTLAWHNLSPADIALIYELRGTASDRYENYVNRQARTKSAILGSWYADGDKDEAFSVTFYYDGTCDWTSYHNDWSGSYSVSGNTVNAYFPLDSSHWRDMSRTFIYQSDDSIYCPEMGSTGYRRNW